MNWGGIVRRRPCLLQLCSSYSCLRPRVLSARPYIAAAGLFLISNVSSVSPVCSGLYFVLSPSVIVDRKQKIVLILQCRPIHYIAFSCLPHILICIVQLVHLGISCVPDCVRVCVKPGAITITWWVILDSSLKGGYTYVAQIPRRDNDRLCTTYYSRFIPQTYIHTIIHAIAICCFKFCPAFV